MELEGNQEYTRTESWDSPCVKRAWWRARARGNEDLGEIGSMKTHRWKGFERSSRSSTSKSWQNVENEEEPRLLVFPIRWVTGKCGGRQGHHRPRSETGDPMGWTRSGTAPSDNGQSPITWAQTQPTLDSLGWRLASLPISKVLYENFFEEMKLKGSCHFRELYILTRDLCSQAREKSTSCQFQDRRLRWNSLKRCQIFTGIFLSCYMASRWENYIAIYILQSTYVLLSHWTVTTTGPWGSQGTWASYST